MSALEIIIKDSVFVIENVLTCTEFIEITAKPVEPVFFQPNWESLYIPIVKI